MRYKEIYVNIHHFIGRSVYIFGLVTCALGFQDMQSSDLASSTSSDSSDSSSMDTSGIGGGGGINITTSGTIMDLDMDGYLYNSVFAQLASAGTIVLGMLGKYLYI